MASQERAADRVAVLVNPTSPNNDAISANLKTASSELGLELHVLNAINEQELDEAFAKMAELKAGGGFPYPRAMWCRSDDI